MYKVRTLTREEGHTITTLEMEGLQSGPCRSNVHESATHCNVLPDKNSIRPEITRKGGPFTSLSFHSTKLPLKWLTKSHLIRHDAAIVVWRRYPRYALVHKPDALPEVDIGWYSRLGNKLLFHRLENTQVTLFANTQVT